MEHQTDELTLSDILHIFKKRQIWFWIIFVLTIFATLIYLVFFATPIYEVSTKIKIPVSSGKVSLPSSLSGAVAFISGGSVSSPGLSDQIEIIKSRKTLEKVINDLNLMDYFKSKIIDEEAKEKLTINSVISRLQQDIITVEPLKDTSFLEIKVSLDDKEMAYKLSKALIDAYTQISKELNKDENTYLIEFIEKQLPKTEKELLEIEEKLKQFKKTKSILPSKEAELLINSLSGFDTQYYSTQIEYTTLKAKLKDLKSKISEFKDLINKLEYIPNNSIISLLRQNLVRYQIEYKSSLEKYSPNSIEIKELEIRIRETEKKIKEEIDNIVKSSFNLDDPILSNIYSQIVETQAAIEISKAKLEALSSLKRELENKIKSLPDIEQEYLALERDYQLKQSAYILLKQKLEEAKLSTAGFTLNVPIIIDEPFIPEEPAKPNKKLVLAIGGVLGIFLGILVVFLAEAGDKKVRDSFDIEQLTGKEPIVIPEDSKNSNSEFSNGIKTLSLNLLKDVSTKIIGITSVGKFEEKSDISLELSKFFALSEKTLLVDLDFENSYISKILKIENKPIIDKENNIYKFNENLDILLTDKISKPSEFLALIDKFKSEFETIKENYSHIIINLPNSEDPEFVILQTFCEKFVLITKKNVSLKENLIKAYNELKDAIIVLSK